MRRDAKVDAAPLLEATARWVRDPFSFVTQTLHAVPDDWQREVLQEIGGGLATPDEAVRIAVASGHGVGKSALVAWILLWAMGTHEDTRGVVTANTETQLRTKTWAEMAKWLRKWTYREWFDLTSTSVASKVVGHSQTWRLDLVPWSESNAEAFAGLHNHGKRTIVVFDEASAIPDVIWDTTEGALTDKETELLWLVFGNPTRNTGRFRECFARFAHRWRGRQVDSRTVGLTNKAQLQRWVDDYGEDSDFVRVRVRGVFPRAGSMQFIDGETVDEAVHREATGDTDEPLVIGVDVARFGDDRSVIYARRGRDAQSRPPLVLRGVEAFGHRLGRWLQRLRSAVPDALLLRPLRRRQGRPVPVAAGERRRHRVGHHVDVGRGGLGSVGRHRHLLVRQSNLQQGAGARMMSQGSPRATGEAGVSLIRAFEGFSPTPYICPAGFPTVGYGHVVQDGERFEMPLSQEDGEALLRTDLPRYEGAVCRLIDVPLDDLCFDALVSFTFNLGEGALAASTLRRVINVGHLADAGSQFDRWVFAGARKLPGLVRRRAAERLLWERGLAAGS